MRTNKLKRKLMDIESDKQSCY